MRSALRCLSGAVPLAGLAITSWLQPLAAAELDPTTVMVIVTQANVRCLTSTGTMTAKDALAIGNRFLEQEKISAGQRRAVNKREDVEELMRAYIADQGGCDALVRGLKQ
ncbi:MAG: hypothetical protein CBB80_000790 [Synechococcus sp. TMED20]|nr:MAG: hypothetical protein CBB80_000790 [Synechococcus sp. TMED20]